jgi:sulfur dioxygenase
VQRTHNRPIVAVCRAGSRSAQATVILREAGFSDVVNLAGGMLRWRAQAKPSKAVALAFQSCFRNSITAC